MNIFKDSVENSLYSMTCLYITSPALFKPDAKKIDTIQNLCCKGRDIVRSPIKHGSFVRYGNLVCGCIKALYYHTRKDSKSYLRALFFVQHLLDWSKILVIFPFSLVHRMSSLSPVERKNKFQFQFQYLGDYL